MCICENYPDLVCVDDNVNIIKKYQKSLKQTHRRVNVIHQCRVQSLLTELQWFNRCTTPSSEPCGCSPPHPLTPPRARH